MKEFIALSFERFDAQNALLDVTEYFEKGKIKLDFLKYGKDNKQIERIGIFFSPSDAMIFAYNIKEGKIKNALNKLKKAQSDGKLDQKGYQYSEVWKSSIGGNYEKTRYRQLVIQPGIKKTFVMVAQSGPATEGDNGLILPTGAPDMYIRMPMDQRQMLALAFALERAVRYCDDNMVRQWQIKRQTLNIKKDEMETESNAR